MKKILIIENGRQITNMIKRLFKNESFKTYVLDNYLSRNIVIKRNIYDLVIADLTRIKNKKIELLMRLKNSNPISTVPYILIISTTENLSDAEPVIEEKFSSLNYYLAKPFTENELFNMITKILNEMDNLSPW